MADTDEGAAVRAGLGARNPQRATVADVDASVLRLHGLGDLSDRMWLEGAAVSAEARKSVRRHVRARFGPRAPRTGPLPLLFFVILLGVTAPLGLLGSLRQGASGVEPAAGALTAALGIAAIVVVACAGGRPFNRATLLQAGGLVVLVGAAAVIGSSLTTGVVRILFLVGAAGSVIAFLLVVAVRARDREATHQIDSALEIAHLDVAPEVALERERMLTELASAIGERRDLAAMRRARTAAIQSLRSIGNPVEDSAPQSLPGTYIVLGQTSAWMPSDVAHARPAGLGG